MKKKLMLTWAVFAPLLAVSVFAFITGYQVGIGRSGELSTWLWGIGHAFMFLGCYSIIRSWRGDAKKEDAE